MPRNSNGRRLVSVKKLAALILVFSMSAAVYLGYRGFSELNERKQGITYYQRAAQNRQEHTIEAPVQPESTEAHADQDQPEETYTSALDFEALREIYPDCVGWIEIDDIGVDYPIVRGRDNDYYLHHLADGTPNECGAIMMDVACRADFGSDSTIIHGHHLRNGTMFGSLGQFGDRTFFAEHPVFRIFTPDGDYDVQVFAAYTADPSMFGYPTEFEDAEALRDFLSMIREHASNVSDVDIRYGDKLVILSTCAYSFENARFVVVGKMIKKAD